MKLPKKTKRYCPKCKKATEMTIKQVKYIGRSKSRTMSRGALGRMRKRGLRRGYGNYGKYSRPPKPNRTGAKVSKKPDLRYVCSVCKKALVQKKGFRTKKVEFE